MTKRTILVWCLAIIGLICAMIAYYDIKVEKNAVEKTYENVDSVPHRKVGLVLGTSSISTWNGRRNYYFDHRIKAAVELYKAGKVEWLVVSGGDYRNTENGYDEPVAMRDSLIKQGVDSTHIVLDYDGTRTLNSAVKMRDVYRQDSSVISLIYPSLKDRPARGICRINYFIKLCILREFFYSQWTFEDFDGIASD